ncbi:SPOR domain-containing protein [Parashewanella curva]|uniref:SPOR domain-containing protein n=1 Tax=Parashewanella curva TaxID=2338552 RepID=A0A3L8PW93_9GAMM|nr:SPOR domain-containing protein [Parashewanella curva]RLV58708.1 SPOR domain-containing protein [Parashewanella curva]
MSNQFQNRLVGTIVVVALGVIFLPDMLDGKDKRQEENFSEIPLRPEFSGDLQQPLVVDVQPNYNPDIESASASSNEQVNDSKNTESLESNTEQPQPKQDNQAKVKSQPSVPDIQQPTLTNSVAYTIQLGSFNNAKNANALVQRLRKQGFRAYSVPKVPKNKQLTRVYVGPDISKTKLAQTQQKLHEFTQMKGRIVNYDPISQ